MSIKLKLIAFSLLGYISTCLADTKFFEHNAVSIESIKNQPGYNILINKLRSIPRTNKSFLDSFNTSSDVKEIDKLVWRINTATLPITIHDCYKANEDICDEESTSCYNHCLTGLEPEIIAFDEKANKVYFLMGTISIGSGGGPALLFMADINKREIKLLHEEWYQEFGSLSPSGRYLVINGNSILKLYDTQNYNRSELNKTENSYAENNNIRHALYVKKWLNDAQFLYVDIARYFVRPIPENGEPFYSAKEVTYDIASRKILSQREITKEQADAYENTL